MSLTSPPAGAQLVNPPHKCSFGKFSPQKSHAPLAGQWSTRQSPHLHYHPLTITTTTTDVVNLQIRRELSQSRASRAHEIAHLQAMDAQPNNPIIPLTLSRSANHIMNTCRNLVDTISFSYNILSAKFSNF